MSETNTIFRWVLSKEKSGWIWEVKMLDETGATLHRISRPEISGIWHLNISGRNFKSQEYTKLQAIAELHENGISIPNG